MKRESNSEHPVEGKVENNDLSAPLEQNAAKQDRLDRLVREAKIDLAPRDLDWSKIETNIMSRIARERPALLDDLQASSSRTRAMRIGAVVLAAAAGFALVARRDALPIDGAGVVVADTAAGALRATEGAGEVRVSGVVASPGTVLHAGDLVETTGARAVLERPRKVTWVLEHADATNASDGASGTGTSDGKRAARARVKSAGDALVLGLDDGAIEAQVTPVPSGEAFAIDVATPSSLVRVAVHGTHLRVARSGARVVVDLTEGVVSIGVPPRTGATYGTLVTAPAHVEFDATNLAGSLRVDHAFASVRPALPLSGHEPPLAARPDAQATPAPAAKLAVTPPNGGQAPGPGARLPEATAPTSGLPKDDALKGNGTKAVVGAREAIVAAVRACAAAKSRPGDVRITVTTSLRLRARAGGDIESAQFDPPLNPDVQTCAAAAIFKVKLDDPGAMTFPIEFSY